MPGIVGIGLDLIDLEYFQIHYGSGDPELLARCFTEGETADAGNGQDRTARLAARFAAKEAAFKALGGAADLALTDIELVHSESGQPQIRLHGAAKTLADRCGVLSLFVSLTHSASAAAAVVVAISDSPR